MSQSEIILPQGAPVAPDAPARFPRMADFLLNPATAWRVGPSFAAQPKFTEHFAQNVRAQIQSPRCAVLDCDAAKVFLDEQKPEEWDLTRDIPQAKPIADLALWEWYSPTPPVQSGVLCKGIVKRDLDSAIEELVDSQNSAFDYDVAIALKSLRSARAHIAGEDVKAPVIVLVCSVFDLKLEATLRKKLGKVTGAHQFEICPIGTFGLSLNARGRPIPDSLVEYTWDDPTDAKFSREAMLPRLRATAQNVLLMHTLFRALEAVTHPVAPEEVVGKGPFAGRELVGHHRLDLRTLPKKLNEEAFADKDGLKTALSYMPGKWATPPVVWPK